MFCFYTIQLCHSFPFCLSMKLSCQLILIYYSTIVTITVIISPYILLLKIRENWKASVVNMTKFVYANFNQINTLVTNHLLHINEHPTWPHCFMRKYEWYGIWRHINSNTYDECYNSHILLTLCTYIHCTGRKPAAKRTWKYI